MNFSDLQLNALSMYRDFTKAALLNININRESETVMNIQFYKALFVLWSNL